jgi:hypothetical protein
MECQMMMICQAVLDTNCIFSIGSPRLGLFLFLCLLRAINYPMEFFRWALGFQAIVEAVGLRGVYNMFQHGAPTGL